MLVWSIAVIVRGANEVESISDDWFERYKLDMDIGSLVAEDYQKYRRDFMPRFGRIDLGIKPIVKKHDVLLKDLVIAGRGDVTRPYKCGSFLGYMGCDLHDMVEGRLFFYSCGKPSCSRCYFSWADKLGYVVASRLEGASKLFGSLCEHVVCSLPKSDYGLTLNASKRKTIDILFSRGITGGYLIPHGNRVNKKTGEEFYSPHWHCLVFIEPSYERCRNCERKWNCRADCGGFDDVNYQLKQKDGYFIKVLGKRLSVSATARYQLNHCSVDYSRRRARVGFYFGKCGYNNLSIVAERQNLKCSVCGAPYKYLDYVGSNPPVTDRFNPHFNRVFKRSKVEDGYVVWVVREFNP